MTETNPLSPDEQSRLQRYANELSEHLGRILGSPDHDAPPIDAIPKLMLACVPKSGSTWLTRLLEAGLQIASTRCYLAPDRNEQEIDPVVLWQTRGKPVLYVQQHVRASVTTLRLCRAFGVKIIVLTRSLEDAAVSFRDHILRESAVAPMFYMEREWFTALDPRTQLDFIIDHCLPWYVNFVVGWSRARNAYPNDILALSYESLVSDPHAALASIGRFYGRDLVLDANAADLKDGVRFNQGRIGRGREELTAEQRKRIRRLVDYYPAVPIDL